ncbi:splicing factor [Quaeritorhiza haematococci]|nr:splicing factor [Quaeritorhiza haematococci]
MALAEQRKLLEALMGKQALGGAPDTLTFDDPKVCRNHLCGLCPHDLFTNTKMDIGPCPKTHSEKLKKEYEDAATNDPRLVSQFQRDWFESLSEFIADCDRTIAKQQKRLDKTPDDAKVVQLLKDIGDMTNEIADLTSVMEKLGDEGKVAESMDVLKTVDELKEKKEEKERQLKAISGSQENSQQQKLRVCEICSAYLSIFDSDRRLADHFGGKMHMGFMNIRKKVDELKAANNYNDFRGRFDRGGSGGYGRGGGGYRGGSDFDRDYSSMLDADVTETGATEVDMDVTATVTGITIADGTITMIDGEGVATGETVRSVVAGTVAGLPHGVGDDLHRPCSRIFTDLEDTSSGSAGWDSVFWILQQQRIPSA